MHNVEERVDTLEGVFRAYLTKNKIYAMAIKDDTMDLLNFENIKD